MYRLMSPHVTLVMECFITHITDIQTLATMDKLVSLHIKLLTECFLTHITRIRMLATM
jgi:hypothetical protein